MDSWEEQVKLFEHYIAHINHPATAYRMKAWFKRLGQIKSNPQCTSLDDLGVPAPYTVDLSVLYPRRQRRAA